jgi:hypothetical protein
MPGAPGPSAGRNAALRRRRFLWAPRASAWAPPPVLDSRRGASAAGRKSAVAHLWRSRGPPRTLRRSRLSIPSLPGRSGRRCDRDGPFGTLAVTARRRRAFGAETGPWLLTVANVLVSAGERAASEQRVRHRALHDPSPACRIGRCCTTISHRPSHVAPVAPARLLCCSRTSTASRPSTIATATTPAITCCESSLAVCAPACAPSTRWRGSAAMSSSSFARTPTPKPPRALLRSPRRRRAAHRLRRAPAERRSHRGLAWRDAHHDVDGDALLREADAAMHEEKSRLPPAA